MNFEKIGKKKIPKWFGWGVIGLLMAYGAVNLIVSENALSKYGVKTEAVIISYKWGNKGIKDIQFQFKVDEVCLQVMDKLLICLVA